METLQYETQINASAAKVWEVLWNDTTLRHWMSVFSPGCYAESDWKEGSKILFMGPFGEGISSLIHERRENEKMSFSHHYNVVNGQEVKDGNNEGWNGALEIYSLSENNGITTLRASIETLPAYIDYYNAHFPTALQCVKELAEGSLKPRIFVIAKVMTTAAKAWDCWTSPEHITRWNFAIDSWHCPWAKVDLREGGQITSRMEAKDGSMGFEFTGKYTLVKPHERLTMVLEDGRVVDTIFTQTPTHVQVVESFEPEGMNPHQMQREGWQAILNNYAAYASSNQ